VGVTFKVEGERLNWAAPDTFVDANLSNAAALLAWLDLPADLHGQLPARELAARCRRRLWPEARNVDEGEAGAESGRVISGGRRPGYLEGRTADLLRVCDRAGDRNVVWG